MLILRETKVGHKCDISHPLIILMTFNFKLYFCLGVDDYRYRSKNIATLEIIQNMYCTLRLLIIISQKDPLVDATYDVGQLIMNKS